ncbi:MAG TPA: MBL fold metallo-hydrolase [Deltaproteobacteria bacterium]|nr:MBL fold metallo-hydrolase [Deltaproteobacteria bacterium]
MQARTLTAVLGNSQRLDGGAMFGNAPKALWSRWIEPDEANRIPLACRSLLIQEPGRNVLLETGIGAFFEPRLRERFGVVEPEHVLLSSLERLGLSHHDIDVVVLSHLHFDHAGGLLSAWAPDQPPQLLFPRATFVVGAGAWQRARHPHPRDRASFIEGLCDQLEASGRLELVSGTPLIEGGPATPCPVLGPGYRTFTSEGHTPGLLLTELEMPAGPVVFAADLVPGRPWVHLPITMGYDRYPERLIDEKRALLSDLIERGGRLFYTHDAQCALSGLTVDERGRLQATDPVEAPVALSA